MWIGTSVFSMYLYSPFSGAVASSAPVFGKLNFLEYMDVVTASLGTTGPDCVKNVANATNRVQSLLSSLEGAKQLTELFM